jgi:glutamyl-tRNA reductase
MHLILVGVSHRTAPVDLRERLDFQARGIETALRALGERGATREAAVVSTCNRAEIYAACEDVQAAREELVRFISQFHGVDQAVLAPHIYDLADLEAARHLFRVAAGLDSQVVGEPQILGQVKDAHAAAGHAAAVGPVLNRLFHFSFGVGKRVRTETALGSGAVSIGFAAVALAKKIFGDLKGRNVLVVGAGEMGKLTAIHMKKQGVSRVTIISRTMTHAAATAEEIGGASAAPWEEMDAALGAADIVITATGAGQPILTKARIESVMRPRRSRPLFIIDIALPRDVEAAASEIEQVFLYNIDDLQMAVQENLAKRASEVHRAEEIVGEEVEKFGGWFKARGAIPTVVALRQHAEQIRKSELDRLSFKMSSLSPEARGRVDEITRLIVEKLLLTPTEQLKSLGDSETIHTYTEVVARLFGLSMGGHEEDPDAPQKPQSGNVEQFRPSAGRDRRKTGR